MDAELSTQMEKVGCHSKAAMKVVSSGLSTECDQQAAVDCRQTLQGVDLDQASWHVLLIGDTLVSGQCRGHNWWTVIQGHSLSDACYVIWRRKVQRR